MNALKFLGLEDKVVVKEVQKRGSTLPPIKLTVKDIRDGKVYDAYTGQIHEVVLFLRKAK
jgi:hypothetical protein